MIGWSPYHPVRAQRLVSEDGRQRLLFFTAPPGSPAVGQLDLLAVVGRQQLAVGARDD